MKIQIATKHLIGALAGKHHFNTHGLYLTCHKIHRCGCADRGNVKSFKMINNIIYRVGALLYCEYNFVMNGPDVLCDDSGVL